MDNQNISSFCTIDLIVDTAAKAAVPSKATVGQAVDAVKEHIIRSLCSRAGKLLLSVMSKEWLKNH